MLLVLSVFTVLSRLGYLNLIGTSIILSTSMEPALRPGDMVIYLNMNYSVGDIIVYSLTPSHCIVHRVVGFIRVSTVNGDRLLVVTKGDNNELADSPFTPDMVRGKVIFTLAREVWLPIIIAMIAYSLHGTIKTPIIGYTYTTLLAIGLISLITVYAVTPGIIAVDNVKPPILNLAGVYFNPETCTVSIRYTGELSLTSIEVKVNSTGVEILQAAEREVVFRPDPDLVREAFERGKPLCIEVKATLNHVGRLSGEYTLLVGGRDPEISGVDGALIIRNPNCFPLSISTSIRYLAEGSWLWRNQTHILGSLSHLIIEPPEGAELAYAYIYWFNQGDRRWVGLPLKRR